MAKSDPTGFFSTAFGGFAKPITDALSGSGKKPTPTKGTSVANTPMGGKQTQKSNLDSKGNIIKDKPKGKAKPKVQYDAPGKPVKPNVAKGKK
jgi:hypothetical protein